MLLGVLGFVVLVIGIGLITDSSVRMRGGRTKPKSRGGGLVEMLLGILVGMFGFAMLLYAITGGPPT